MREPEHPTDPSADTMPATPSPEGLALAETSSAAADDPTGASAAIPGGRYELGKALGRGGMGDVLCAIDDQIGREVAIKRMRVAPTPEAVARFEREARIQGRLEHPSIVPVHELARDADGRPYFVMKRLAGTTLADLLADADPDRQQRASRQRLLGAFVDVCFAIELAHQRGVVHRDLKPSNVMLGDYREVYVLDWGVARVLGEEADVAAFVDLAGSGRRTKPSSGSGATPSTQVGAIIGTPGYLAPEQVRGEPVGPGADVYALGCILYELLCRQPLFPRPVAMTAPLERFDPLPSRRTDDVPPELDSLCGEALASEPSARPTARALGEAVERYLDGDRDVARRKQLAAEHLAAAQAALARGDGEAERTEAMRAAGRALALDPSGTEAASLIGRLMLEPPAATPRAVDDALEQQEARDVLDQTVLHKLTMAAYGVMIATLAIGGLRDGRYFAAFAILIGLNVWLIHRTTRLEGRVGTGAFVLAAVLNAAMIAMFARTVTPFLVGPGIAAGTIMAFALYPQYTRPWLLWPIFGAAVLGPVALEHVGVLSRTIAATGDHLVLTSPVFPLRMPLTEILLIVYVAGLLAVCAMIGSGFAQAQRTARRALELQAWHLRQLAGIDSAVSPAPAAPRSGR